MVSFSVATPADYSGFYKADPPDVWTALVGRQGGRVVGMAGVVYDDYGRAWAFLDALIRPTFALHRQALRFFAAMRQVGEPAIYTTCGYDQSPRAEAWLRRLGFEITDEFGPTDQAIWKWTP